ncbi:hypothetical protein MBLNU459_g5311t1 [Dothideomycetes sp. NU459]
MYKQATLGEVDFITGDYLAEVNLAKNAEDFAAGKHSGYEDTAWEGLRQTIEVIHAKRIKIAINGGALNPEGLAARVAALIHDKGFDLKVAYVTGDDISPELPKTMPRTRDSALLPHLDSVNEAVDLHSSDVAFVGNDGDSDGNYNAAPAIVSANAYLGARGVVAALRHGADIVICGRVSDASPVIAAAWYWWDWADSAYDELAGSLVAGHLIECSAYVTGGNFAGFDRYDQDVFVEPGFPIAEIDADGSCVITKHEGTGGMGNVYLHSDSQAVLDGVVVAEVGKDRVRVHGIKGLPPPPTTKLAVFYKGGFEVQLLFNATGYAAAEKSALFERQVRLFIGEASTKKIDLLEFQNIGIPASNPEDQNSSTVYIRIFAQSRHQDALLDISRAVGRISLKHFSGFHSSADMRTAIPRPYLAYYPAIWPQDKLHEAAHFIDHAGHITQSVAAGHPPIYQPLGARASYDAAAASVPSFTGATRTMRLGDIALARSGDKGANLNVGVFVAGPRQYGWLRGFLSTARMKAFLGRDWRDGFVVERVEFPGIWAVHFVVYGILGRGVSSASRLDGFGKGFADYLRDKVVDVPVEIL